MAQMQQHALIKAVQAHGQNGAFFVVQLGVGKDDMLINEALMQGKLPLTQVQVERLMAEGVSREDCFLFLKSADDSGEIFGALQLKGISSNQSELIEWASMAGVLFSAIAECEVLSRVKTKDSVILITYLLSQGAKATCQRLYHAISRERTQVLEMLLTDCIEAENDLEGSPVIELDSALGIKLAQLLVE